MNQYQTTLRELKRNIHAQKTIYKFRMFLYSINKDIRHNWFDICKGYLQNEYNNMNTNTEMTMTERERLTNVLGHWNWTEFEQNSTNWWYILTTNHCHSLTLMTMIHLWIDDVNEFDPEGFETSTLGLQ